MNDDRVTSAPTSPRHLSGIAVVLCLLLSSCTLGPDPERPVTAADAAPAFVHAPESAAAAFAGDRWWQRFGDPALDALVEEALERNLELEVAAARVLEAQAALDRAAGARWPQVQAGASGTRSKSSFVLPSVGRVGIYSTTYAADLSVSYQVDLFGRLARSRQAAWADLLASGAAAEVVRHSVISQVVRARVQIATLERALGIAGDIRSSWQTTLGTVERRYESGVVQALDLRLARENLASAQGAEVAVEGALAQARLALDVLLGRRPGTGAELPQTLPLLPDLEPIPPGLPADLLDRRPDLRQAEMRLAAATSRVGVALADLYPTLSLTGSAGTRSDDLSELVSTDGLIYNAVASLLGPLFTGGQRRAEVDAARARVDQAAATYAQAVLVALREVEGALVADATSRRQVELATRRVEEARSADRISRDRYQRGVQPMLAVLETERRLRAAEEALITARADLWLARVNLFLALGGDWRSTSEPPNLSEVSS